MKRKRQGGGKGGGKKRKVVEEVVEEELSPFGTKVVNVKVAFLRKRGFENFKEWQKVFPFCLFPLVYFFSFCVYFIDGCELD